MKKIITLSIVCLASGQLFAQAAKAQPADTKTKQQIEAQKQKELAPMSLKQAADQAAVSADVAPALPLVAVEAVTQKVAADAPKTELSTAAKQVQEVKQVQPVKQATAVKAAPKKEK